MRDQWNSKLGFILAAIGSAVGLGNLWRFPYVAATNGGGAFIFPYLFAILTAGIPILILEYTMGKTYRSGAPGIFAKINRKFEWVGWLQMLTAFLINVYYFAIVVWVLSYLGLAFGSRWGDDTNSFFFNDYLHITDQLTHLGGIQTHLILPFLIVWAIAAFIMYRGINKGIDIACKICLPILMLCICIIFVRGITLPGAMDGIAYMFTPDWSAIAKSDVWVAAYGQVFFSLSIAFGIMVSYSSYLPKKEDVVNTAFLTACCNHGFEVFAGIGIFSIIGYLAYAQGVGVEDVSAAGVGLAFVVFPTAISTLPAFNSLIGVMFFLSLFVAGVTSLVSISQAVVTGVQDKWEMSHTKAVTVVLAPAFVLSFLFITGAGLYILDLADYIANNLGIVAGGVLEVLLIGWLFQPEKLRKAANEYSNFSIGAWWTWCLKFITVIILGYTFITNIITYLKDGYEGYPMWVGYVIMAYLAIGTIILTLLKGKPGFYACPADAPHWEKPSYYQKLGVVVVIILAIIITVAQIVGAAGGSTGMSTGGNAMMGIACLGLWGGIALAIAVMFHHNKMSAKEALKAYEEAEPETAVGKNVD